MQVLLECGIEGSVIPALHKAAPGPSTSSAMDLLGAAFRPANLTDVTDAVAGPRATESSQGVFPSNNHSFYLKRVNLNEDSRPKQLKVGNLKRVFT